MLSSLISRPRGAAQCRAKDLSSLYAEKARIQCKLSARLNESTGVEGCLCSDSGVPDRHSFARARSKTGLQNFSGPSLQTQSLLRVGVAGQRANIPQQDACVAVMLVRIAMEEQKDVTVLGLEYLQENSPKNVLELLLEDLDA
ncbi:hypothetical protein BJV77DRAFT_963661 [Russula vinacea]|nr:hypothetical protein BJV77DRAFT_963661 [Russula vinacea]